MWARPRSILCSEVWVWVSEMEMGWEGRKDFPPRSCHLLCTCCVRPELHQVLEKLGNNTHTRHPSLTQAR